MNIITLLSFISLCTLCTCDEIVNYKPIDDTNGGATTHDWTGEFVDINGNACSGCDYCDGTGLRNIFSIDLDNFCTECSSESTCNKFRIENKFGRGWPIKFIVLTSSNASIAEDPSGMTTHASIDSRTRPWEELQILQSDLQLWDDSDGVVFLPERDKMHTYVLKNYNHEYYKDYALEWTLPAASSTMQVGTYHIDESYLASYSAEITQELYGIACFLPSKMKPTPELMVGIIKNPTTEYVVSFDMHINEPFTAHGPIVEFKACQNCSWKTYGSRMPSFWSHSARKSDQMQFVSSTQNKADPTQTNANKDTVNIPGLTPFVMHTIRVVAVGNKVDFFMDDMTTPKDTINQDSADRPPVGDLYVFLGAAKSIQQSIDNVYVQNVVYTIIASPTESPTITPTGKPTESPTLDPTITPTSKPTELPTNTPTVTPTSNPTISPPYFTDNNSFGTAVSLWLNDKPQAMTQYGEIKYWKTGKVTSMRQLFYNWGYFNEDLSLWDVSNVSDTYDMFHYAARFNSDLSKWNISKITNMSKMFYVAQAFNQKLCWDISEGTNTDDMFQSSQGSIGCD